MNEQNLIIMEIVFNIIYLLAIWIIVFLMFFKKKKGLLNREWKPEITVNKAEPRFRWGFFLLALGDTGHVGFRVWAYALGGLDTVLKLGPFSFYPVGAGALATAVTVTFLYMLLLDIYRIQTDSKINTVYMILTAAAVIRFILFFFPQNQWSSPVPPFGWGIIRNAGLIVIGIGVALLYIVRLKIPIFRRLGIYILLSYAFYLPVILMVRKVPVIGMLMIPKTLMYIAMAMDVLRNMYTRPAR